MEEFKNKLSSETELIFSKITDVITFIKEILAEEEVGNIHPNYSKKDEGKILIDDMSKITYIVLLVREFNKMFSARLNEMDDNDSATIASEQLLVKIHDSFYAPLLTELEAQHNNIINDVSNILDLDINC